MPTALIVISVIVLVLFVSIIGFFYFKVLNLNIQANTFLSEIEDGLLVRANMIKAIDDLIQEKLDNSEEIFQDFTKSEKTILHATNISELSSGDKLFIQTLFDLLINSRLPKALKSELSFQRLVIELLKTEENLQKSREAYNVTISLIEKQSKTPFFSIMNQLVGHFPPRPLYELGPAKSKVLRLLKLGYE